jgi:hypothetical protein
MEMPSGRRASEFISALAKASSFCATTKECALTVSMRNFPSGQASMEALERVRCKSLILMT